MLIFRDVYVVIEMGEIHYKQFFFINIKRENGIKFLKFSNYF
jgi:hypothetical protein